MTSYKKHVYMGHSILQSVRISTSPLFNRNKSVFTPIFSINYHFKKFTKHIKNIRYSNLGVFTHTVYFEIGYTYVILHIDYFSFHISSVYKYILNSFLIFVDMRSLKDIIYYDRHCMITPFR